MNYEKMTLKVQDALQEASSIAHQKDHSEIGSEHLLLAFLQQEGGIAYPLVERIGVSAQKLIDETNSLLQTYPVVREMPRWHFLPRYRKFLPRQKAR